MVQAALMGHLKRAKKQSRSLRLDLAMWLYKHFLPKNPVDLFLHSRKTNALVLVKEPDKNREKIFFNFKMAHFTSQNGPFCSAK